MTLIRFQLLHCLIEIDGPDPQVQAALAYLVVDAVQDVVPRITVRYQVTAETGGFVLTEGGLPVAVGLDASGVMQKIYTLAHEKAYSVHPPHLRIHAALATVSGRRVMIVGPKRAGKTTLITRLLHDGVDVHGDELVLVDADGLAIAFPRRFHVRPGTFLAIPELSGRQEHFPSTRTPKGTRICAMAPTDFGRDWQISAGPLDAVIHLERSQNALSRLEEIPSASSLERLHWHTAFPARSILWSAALLRVVNTAKNFVLLNGDLTEAAAVVKRLWNHEPKEFGNGE